MHAQLGTRLVTNIAYDQVRRASPESDDVHVQLDSFCNIVTPTLYIDALVPTSGAVLQGIDHPLAPRGRSLAST